MADNDLPDSQTWVTIHHPKLGGEAEVTMLAYNVVWKDRGFRLGPSKAAADMTTKES